MVRVLLLSCTTLRNSVTASSASGLRSGRPPTPDNLLLIPAGGNIVQVGKGLDRVRRPHESGLNASRDAELSRTQGAVGFSFLRGSESVCSGLLRSTSCPTDLQIATCVCLPPANQLPLTQLAHMQEYLETMMNSAPYTYVVRDHPLSTCSRLVGALLSDPTGTGGG
jgi:hypothetical protein